RSAISGGQIGIISPVGTWIDSFDFAGGTFTVGPDTYTGGPVGLMSLLGNAEIEIIILPTPMTVDEQAKMVAYAHGLGSAGLITREATALVNGGFDSSLAGWAQLGGTFTWVSGRARMVVASNGNLRQNSVLSGNGVYLVSYEIANYVSGDVRAGIIGTPPVLTGQTRSSNG